MEDYITATELLVMLLVGGGPVYLVSALIQLGVLRRARASWLRAGIAVLSAALVALPLTVVAWWASGYLPETAMPWIDWAARPSDLVPESFRLIAAFVAPPALIACALVFPLATWLARRKLE